MRKQRLLAGSVAVALGLTVAATGCSDSEQPSGGPIDVVATTTILADIAANIVGDSGTVTALLPVGASPHDYQPSAQQVSLINSADLVVANGLLLEEGLLDVLDSAQADGANVLEVAPLVNPIPFAGTAHDEHDEHDRDDPHFWLDPQRAALAARLIAENLTTISPATDWLDRAEAYAMQLSDTDQQISEALKAIPEEKRKLVTNHGSFGYFAERYGFEIIGIVIPGGSTLADPSSAELSNLVALIERQSVSAIFGETTEPAALAEAIAAESGHTVQVVELYTGSVGAVGSGAETLIDMLITNATRIVDAIG